MSTILDNSREENIKVWEDTKWLFSKEGPYNVKSSKSNVIHNLDQLKFELTDKSYNHWGTTIEVVNDDTITYAKTFMDQGLNPIVLNMASHVYPGGGVRQGCRAQEEDLFRRSNYHRTLNKYSLPKGTYPLKETTIIYSPNVCIIKDKNYKELKNPFFLNFIACPAIRNPQIEYNNVINPYNCYYKDSDQKTLTKRKIEMIYLTGILMGHDSMVLGALGCGAFNNPTNEVVEMFDEMNKKYGGYFKKIGFAVLSFDGDTKYQTFKNKLT